MLKEPKKIFNHTTGETHFIGNILNLFCLWINYLKFPYSLRNNHLFFTVLNETSPLDYSLANFCDDSNFFELLKDDIWIVSNNYDYDDEIEYYEALTKINFIQYLFLKFTRQLY